MDEEIDKKPTPHRISSEIRKTELTPQRFSRICSEKDCEEEGKHSPYGLFCSAHLLDALARGHETTHYSCSIAGCKGSAVLPSRFCAGHLITQGPSCSSDRSMLS